MPMAGEHYDLVVIGSGPAGQKAAINAAKSGKRVAVIERAGMIGGASVHSGTIPSKTVRDAVLYLTGFNERAFYGQEYRLREQINGGEIASPTTGGAFLLRRDAPRDIPRFRCRGCFIKKHESGRTLAVAHTDAVTALNLT